MCFGINTGGMDGWDKKTMTEDEWSALQKTLSNTIGQNNYANWIAPLEFSCVEGDIAVFNVPTNFLGNYVSQNFGDVLLYRISESNGSIKRIRFNVPENKPLNTMQSGSAHNPVSKNAKSDQSVQKDEQLPGAPLDQRFKFDTFVVGKPNELAHAAAKRVGEGASVTFNPLFLYGGVGLGKTHLMHAIAWELQSRRPELNVLYLSAEQFMYRFVQALRDRKMMDFKQLFRSVDVLMVDDVQFIAGKDSTQEEFFHTFNALVDQNKQIINSADRAPGEIKDGCNAVWWLICTQLIMNCVWEFFSQKLKHISRNIPTLPLNQMFLNFLHCAFQQMCAF